VGVNYHSRAAHAESLVAEIAGPGGRAVAVQADVGDPVQVTAMTARVAKDLGAVSILVNNAALMLGGDLEDFDYGLMDRMNRTNVDGVVNVTRAVLPAMKARGYGRIVNVTSIAAHGTTLPGTTFYAATKAAVALLTRRFARDLGRHGITVNAVAPGFILTDMVTAGRREEEILAMTEAMAARAMVGRVGRPEDVAGAVAFLVAPESGFITAQVLTVDGGRVDYLAHP
jgi:3-oxoacyl-[acyl-carrier protein] reductase